MALRILVTRPLPGGEATAALLTAAGYEVVLAPLLSTEAVAWTAPPAAPSAVMLTSAVAVRLAGTAADLDLPAFVVGRATAAAARAAGYRDVRDGSGTAQALLDDIAAAGFADVLHLAGEDRTPVTVPPGLQVATVVVYRARLLPLVGGSFDVVVLYSARTAAHFAAECTRLGLRRDAISVAAISDKVLAAAGHGWARSVAAVAPREDALLAAIAATWQ